MLGIFDGAESGTDMLSTAESYAQRLRLAFRSRDAIVMQHGAIMASQESVGQGIRGITDALSHLDAAG